MPKKPAGVGLGLVRRFELPEFGSTALPEELEGFRRTNYTTIQRVAGDPLGMKPAMDVSRRRPRRRSSRSTIRTAACMTCASAIRRSAGPSPTSGCCSRTNCRRARPPPGPRGDRTAGTALYGRAVLMFSLLDNRGNIDAVIKDLARGTPAARVNQRLAAVPAAQPTSGRRSLEGALRAVSIADAHEWAARRTGAAEVDGRSTASATALAERVRQTVASSGANLRADGARRPRAHSRQNGSCFER